MLNVILYIVSLILYPPLSIWNYFLVEDKKGYFRSSAITIDKLANREFRTLWNAKLRTESGYKFGAENETISSALGKNQRDNTLTKHFPDLVKVLGFLEKDHCIKSINN